MSVFDRAGERRGKGRHALGVIRIDQDFRRPAGQPGGHHVDQFDRRRGNDRRAALLGHVVQTAERKIERGVRILLAELDVKPAATTGTKAKETGLSEFEKRLRERESAPKTPRRAQA